MIDLSTVLAALGLTSIAALAVRHFVKKSIEHSFQTMLQNQKQEHAKELASLKASHAANLESLKAEHSKDVEVLKAELQEEGANSEQVRNRVLAVKFRDRKIATFERAYQEDVGDLTEIFYTEYALPSSIPSKRVAKTWAEWGKSQAKA
jgi:uncharacterized protein HemX